MAAVAKPSLCRSQYATARGDQSEAQQVVTASATPSARTPRALSCWPAKDAAAASSPTAEERTASSVPECAVEVSARTASPRAAPRSGGSGYARVNDASSCRADSSGRAAARAVTRSPSRCASIYRRYPAVVRQKPGGTGKPRRVNRSRFAAFPPSGPGSVASPSQQIADSTDSHLVLRPAGPPL